jgi:hypothetical protein
MIGADVDDTARPEATFRKAEIRDFGQVTLSKPKQLFFSEQLEVDEQKTEQERTTYLAPVEIGPFGDG